MARKDRQVPRSGSAANQWWPIALLGILILFLYGRTIDYPFVLDDDLFIVNNPLVQLGLPGVLKAFGQGSLEHFSGSNFQVYRPITISAFAVQKALFGLSPGGFHKVSLLLYMGVCVLVFRLFERLFRGLHRGYAVVAALIYAVHPAHAEVVANIKGQDELLAALFNMGALLVFAKALEEGTGRGMKLMQATGLYVLGLFTKESSAAFLLVFPLYQLLVAGQREVRQWLSAAPMAVAAALFVLVRHLAIRHIDPAIETSVLENVLYGAQGPAQYSATVASILWQFIRTLFIPYSLSWDYSFNQIPVTEWSSARPWLAVLAFALLGALIVRSWRERPAAAFLLLFFLVMIAPTSNILFLNGTTYADRFLFLPSAAFIGALTLLVAGVLERVPAHHPARQGVRLAGLVVVVTFGGSAMARAGDWRDNFSVFRAGVQHAPNSSRTRAGLATEYMNMAERAQDMRQRNSFADSAVVHFERSLAIMPDNWNAAYKLGLIMAMRGDTTKAIGLYKRSIDARPNVFALNNLGSILHARHMTDSAEVCFRQALTEDPRSTMALTNLCVIYLNRDQLDEAIRFGELALQHGKRDRRIYDLLSMAYGRKGNGEQAARYAQLAKEARS